MVSWTPGLAVGMVTTSGGCIGGSGLDCGGHTALTMPPSRMAASSELGGAGACEHALMTFAATDCSAIWHIGEQPPWKSAGAHEGIWEE